jgi:chromodomain-helicase-DNA-binding protein 1
VTVNAKLVLQAINELEPLAAWMVEVGDRHHRLPDGVHVKDARFDCAWTDADDASLLRGIYKYGTGSWDAIRMDPELDLSRILPDRELKPQAKHLQTRFEYLMRVLKKHSMKEPKPAKVSKPKAAKSRAAPKEPNDGPLQQPSSNGLPDESNINCSAGPEEVKPTSESVIEKKQKSSKRSKTKKVS